MFEMVVTDSGIDLRTAKMDDDRLVAEYYSNAQTETELAEEMGYLVGAYAGVVDEGYGGERMDVTVLAADGSTAGTFHAERGWAESYNTGEMSDEEYSQRVLQTLEANE